MDACRGRAAADISESESEIGLVLRRRRRRNRSTETLTYAAGSDWGGSQCTLSRFGRHAAGFVAEFSDAVAHIVQSCVAKTSCIPCGFKDRPA